MDYLLRGLSVGKHNNLKIGGATEGAGRPGKIGLLRAMRHVLNNDEPLDETRQQKACRQWYLDDPKGFVLKVHALEVEEAERVKIKYNRKKVLAPDMGHDAAMKVLDRLLRDANRVARGESAE